MSTFENALEDALARLDAGETVEQAAAQHPLYTTQLLPVLQAAQRLQQAAPAGAPAGLRQRGRAALLAHMAANPHRGATARSRLGFRYASSMAAILLALATATTAMAQASLPGHALYGLKLASEKVWRAVHFNPIYVDLELSDRRLDELLAVQNDPARASAALAAYATSLDRLELDLTAMPAKALSAQNVIAGQKEQVRAVLEAAGSSADEFFSIIPNLDELIKENPNQLPVITPSLQVPVIVPVIPSGSNNRQNSEQEAGSQSQGQQGSQGGQAEAAGVVDAAEGLLDTAKDVVDDLLGLP